MVLYGLTVSLIILLLICFKGPIELTYLANHGLPLTEQVQAGLKLHGTEAWVKGGILVCILVLQPSVFGMLSLKLIDKCFRFFVVSKLDAKGFLKLAQSMSSAAFSKKELKMSIAEPLEFKTTEVYQGGHAAASMEDITEFQHPRPLTESLLIEMAFFRGSKTQIGLALLLFACQFALVFPLGAIGPAVVASFLSLAVLIGPSLSLYLSLLAYYTQAIEWSKSELRESYASLSANYENVMLKVQRATAVINVASSLISERQKYSSEFRVHPILKDRVRLRESNLSDERTSPQVWLDVNPTAYIRVKMPHIPETYPHHFALRLKAGIIRRRDLPFLIFVLKWSYGELRMRIREYSFLTRWFFLLRLLSIRAGILKRSASIRSRTQVLFVESKRSEYLLAVAEKQENMERAHLPRVARRLELLGELRKGSFSFRCGSFGLKLIAKSRFVSLLTRYCPLF